MLVAMLTITLAGCGLTENYTEPSVEPNTNDYEDWNYETWTEELDLSLVEQYEFSIWSEGASTRIIIDDAVNIERVNVFLGNTVTITHSNIDCYCFHDVDVRMFLTGGRELRFGVTYTTATEGRLIFDNNSAAWISFADVSYDDFMELIMNLGSVV